MLPTPKSSEKASARNASVTAVPTKKKLLNGVNITFTFPGGSRYTGSFKDGKLHGYGVYSYSPSGDLYDGEWKVDAKHGQGTYYYANGDRYVGQWFAGKKHGKGCFIFENGDEYRGSWRDDQMDGFGVFTLGSGDSCYEGYWSQGARHGSGSFRLENGDIYDGEWSKGKEDGFGILEHNNGDIYCGEWNKGQMEGKGVLREKGLYYFVEYVGGYTISKIQYLKEDVVDPEWLRAYSRLVAWEADHPTSEDVRTVTCAVTVKKRLGALNAMDQDLNAARAENIILKNRIDSLTEAFRVRGEGVRGDNETEKSSANDNLATLTTSYECLNEEYQKVLTHKKLLETSVEEQLRLHRLAEAKLSEKEASITELRLQVEKLSKERVVTAASSPADPHAHISRVSVNDDAQREKVMQKLLEEGAQLLKENKRLQTEVTFFKSENAKAANENLQLGEEAEDLRSEIAELKETMHGLLKNNAASSSSSVVEKIVTAEVLKYADSSNNQSPNVPVITANAPIPKTPPRTAEAETSSRIFRQNAELVLENDALQKRIEELQAQASRRPSLAIGKDAQTDIANMRGQLQSLVEELSAANVRETNLERKLAAAAQQLLSKDDQLANLAAKGDVSPAILRSIEEKMERISSMEEENAELARLLEEARMELEVSRPAEMKEKKRHRRRDSSSNAETEEVEKLRRRLKKTLSERKQLAHDLYLTTQRMRRAERSLRNVSGGIVVAVSVDDSTAKPEDKAFAKIDDADASRIVLGGATTHAFDVCFSRNHAVEGVFEELERPLSRVWDGFHVAFVTLGAAQSGKSTLANKLLPLVMRALIAGSASSCSSSISAASSPLAHRSCSFKVAVVEVGPDGAVDCSTGTPIGSVYHDDRGTVVPSDVTYTDCTAGGVEALLLKLMQQRRRRDGGSHLWVQVKCVCSDMVRQTCTCGRFTLVDLCGPGPITAPRDLAVSRFANRSFQALRGVLCGLRDGLPALPYSQCVETALLYDVFGGNCLTTVLGAVHAGPEHEQATRDTVALLEGLSAVRNGPLLQDYVGADELRWRGLVAALNSEEQAERQLTEVGDLREE